MSVDLSGEWIKPEIKEYLKAKVSRKCPKLLGNQY